MNEPPDADNNPDANDDCSDSNDTESDNESGSNDSESDNSNPKDDNEDDTYHTWSGRVTYAIRKPMNMFICHGDTNSS